jgi:hypothetical protein
MMRRNRSWVLAVVAAPVVLVTTLFCADTIAGGRLLWPTPHVSLADAIVLRNAGEVTNQLLNGADPNAPSLLHSGSPRGRPRQVLPVDAAVLSGEVRFLDLLAAHGARFEQPLLVRLHCEADRAGEHEIRAWIEARLGAPADCDR